MKFKFKILISLAIGLLFIAIGISTGLAIALTAYATLDLATYDDRELPVIQYMSFIFALNFLFVPFILYQFNINDYVPAAYQLKLNQQQLFSYLVPCMAALIVGLNLFKTKACQVINPDSIRLIIDRNPSLPKSLMIIGVIAYCTQSFVPASVTYVFFILSNMRFVALFILILSYKKVSITYYVLSYGLLIIQSITTGMFNDFLNLLFFLAFILNIRYKPKWPIKVAAVVSIFILVNTIQSIKAIFRNQLTGNITNDISTLNESLDEAATIGNYLSTEEKLANILSRLNQSWVTASSINYYEGAGYELQNGNHILVILEAVLLPRFLDPNKVTSGSGEIFNKYSGHSVNKGTSIALGAPTDGFVDWGYDGWIFMFFYGLVFNLFLRFIHIKGQFYPLLITFIPIIFYYAVRPDCEIQTTLASMFKTTLLVYFVLILFNRFRPIKINNPLVLDINEA